MKWYVFRHNLNAQRIERWNVFDHSRFREDVQKHLKKCQSREEFAEALRRELFYYYGSKSEWELLFYPWCGGRDTKPLKIDVYEQVRANWEKFVDYVWSQKEER